MKNYAVFILLLSLTNCVTPMPELVNARYKPTKEGVLMLPTANLERNRRAIRESASSLMKKFCEPDRAELVSFDKQSTITGATLTSWSNVGIIENNYASETYVHFQCVTAPQDDKIL